jgi:hypothetical protein
MKSAEADLKKFVVRHLRSRQLPETTIDRRARRIGSEVSPDSQASSQGLVVSGDALLPFLVAARAQAVVAQSRQLGSRALFSEGLASSYEAFRWTRRDPSEGLDEVETPTTPALIERLKGYLDKLDTALPSPEDYAGHPKVAPLVARVVDLWCRGEKVVVFCHFRATGRALEKHIASAIDARLWSDARSKSGLSDEKTRAAVQAFSNRFDQDAAMRRLLEENIRQRLDSAGTSLELPEIAKIQHVVTRFFRTPIFVARHFDFTAQPSEELLSAALLSRDGSGDSLGDKLERFLRFIAIRCNAKERARYLDALDRVQPGIRFDVTSGEDEDSTHDSVRMPNVRLANGETRQETRQRLMLSFNTPFFPDVLIASSVLAEGVDLHLNCRYIIHHDLSWNPSTIEQRTGRVDRIGAKAEYVKKSIEVFLPYVGETQDEKQFRVVMDRERWFQVLMGDDYRTDEFWTEKLAKRLPLPEAAARALAFDLSI